LSVEKIVVLRTLSLDWGVPLPSAVGLHIAIYFLKEYTIVTLFTLTFSELILVCPFTW